MTKSYLLLLSLLSFNLVFSTVVSAQKRCGYEEEKAMRLADPSYQLMLDDLHQQLKEYKAKNGGRVDCSGGPIVFPVAVALQLGRYRYKC